ncbi:Uncharacterized protein OBRU01_25981, partial [Operophtera brumata]
MNEACHRKQASSRNLFRAPYRWLILTNASATKEVLLNSSVLADSDVVIAERSGDQFEMVEIHRPSHNHSAVLTPRGLFKGALHDTRPRRELFRRRMDLMGHVLTMANVIQDSNRTKYHLPREDGLFPERCDNKNKLDDRKDCVSDAECNSEIYLQLPLGVQSRITVWSVFAALMALHAAYSANIVTLLQAPSHSIATLSQLASSKITLAAYDVDYNHFIFAQYKDPVRVSIHKRIEPEKGKQQFYDLSEGVERIRQGLFALHCMDEQVYRRVEQTFLENEKCDLAEIDFMNTFDPFKRIRETGVRSAINRRHQTPKPRCAGHVASFASVGAGELRPVLTLMAIGIALSLAILCMELLIHH